MDRSTSADDGRGRATLRRSGALRGVSPRRALLAVLVLGLAVVLLAPVEPAALLPRTTSGLLIVLGLVALVVGWVTVVVPQLTRRPVLRSGLAVLPVIALTAVLLLPAVVDRRVDEGLLEGVPLTTTASGSAAAAGRDAGRSAATDGTPSASAAATAPAPAVSAPYASEAAAPAAPASPAAPAAPATPAAPAVEPSAGTPDPAPEPDRLSSGALRGVGHRASGEAVVYALDDARFVRLQDIDVQGAVDVVVYLVPDAGQEQPDGGVSLGPLKGTQGSANYVVPDGVDPADYDSVLLWCRAFSTPIAVAPQQRS